MSKSLNQRLAWRRSRPDAPDPVERVATMTRAARTTWLGLLSYLAFVGITLMGVQDADFFLPERETALPLIGVSVPTNLFFYIAPFLGSMLYIHMHLYLLKLWKALGELPASGNRPAGEWIAPWIVSDMALSHRDGATHAYPLRSLARWVSILSIFVAGPALLAAFWWRSMPKHDEVLTILACGVPLFASVLAGRESWRALRRGGGEARHMEWSARGAWAVGLVALSGIGFLTTEGGLTDKFLRPAQLQGVVFVETPPDWLPYDQAEQAYRSKWCAAQGIYPLACGPGPLARDDEGEQVAPQPYLARQRQLWCDNVMPDDMSATDCAGYFADLDSRYPEEWDKARKNAIAALRDRDLSAVDLRGANMRGAQMEGADLVETRMEGADLRLTRMESADLSRARMERADLRWARMERADLGEARMEGADLRWARMEQALLVGARMAGADLRSAQMDGARAVKARMEGADLSRARMEDTDLSWAHMEGADLSRARMDSRTSLSEAIFRKAALRDVVFGDVAMSAAQVQAMFGDASAILPKGVTRPAHWPEWTLPPFGEHAFDTEWRKWRDDPGGYTPPPGPE